MNFKYKGLVEKTRNYISVVIDEELCLDYWFARKSKISEQSKLSLDGCKYSYASDYVFLEVVDGQIVDKEGNIDEF